MNRAERRRQTRNEKKNKEEIILTSNIQKYAPSMAKFHQEQKGTLFDWMLTLDFDDLRFFEDSIEDRSKNCAAPLYLAMLATSLSTGSNTIVDENPETDESTIIKIINKFLFLCRCAILMKMGLVEVKFESDTFFDLESTEHSFRVASRDEVPDEFKNIFDEIDQMSLHYDRK